MDLLVVQGTLKSLLLQHNSKASIWHSAFFMSQLSHPFMTTENIIVLTRWTFVGKVMSLLFNLCIVYFFKSLYSLLSLLHFFCKDFPFLEQF